VRHVKNWKVPLAVFGLGSVGAVFIALRGQPIARWVRARVQEAPGRLAGWNESAQQELARLESALNEIDQSIRAGEVR
jgi:hypothetical protein